MEAVDILNGAEAKELTDWVEQQGLERIKSRALQSEADFYSGAASVLQFLFGKDPKELTKIVPPMWILGVMTGRSPSTRWAIDDTLEESEALTKALDTRLERQQRLYQNAELMYEYVVDMYKKVMVSSTPRQFLQERRALARMLLEDIGLYDFWLEEEE